MSLDLSSVLGDLGSAQAEFVAAEAEARRALAAASAKRRRLVSEAIELGATQAQIAGALGISQPAVHKILNSSSNS